MCAVYVFTPDDCKCFVTTTGEITDTSEFSSTESTVEMPSVSNLKSLPSRRSLLDLLPDKKSKPTSTSSLPSSSNTSVENEESVAGEPPTKRPKIEENEVFQLY